MFNGQPQNSLSAVIGGVVAYLPHHLPPAPISLRRPSPSGAHLPPAKVKSPGFGWLHAASPMWDKIATVLPFRPSRQIFVTGVFMAAVLVNLQAKFFIGSYRIVGVEKPKIKHKF